MKTTQAIKAITTAYSTLKSIDHSNELKKHNLTLSDYNGAIDIFKSLSTPGSSAKTFIKAIADFYKKCGFLVSEDPEKVNYIITT